MNPLVQWAVETGTIPPFRMLTKRQNAAAWTSDPNFPGTGFPASGFSGNDRGSGSHKTALPREGVGMLDVATAEQRDPESGAGEKAGRQNQPRLGVP